MNGIKWLWSTGSAELQNRLTCLCVNTELCFVRNFTNFFTLKVVLSKRGGLFKYFVLHNCTLDTKLILSLSFLQSFQKQ